MQAIEKPTIKFTTYSRFKQAAERGQVKTLIKEYIDRHQVDYIVKVAEYAYQIGDKITYQAILKHL
jgi:hypothetical protein